MSDGFVCFTCSSRYCCHNPASHNSYKYSLMWSMQARVWSSQRPQSLLVVSNLESLRMQPHALLSQPVTWALKTQLCRLHQLLPQTIILLLFLLLQDATIAQSISKPAYWVLAALTCKCTASTQQMVPESCCHHLLAVTTVCLMHCHMSCA